VREIFRLSDAFENKNVDACLEMTAEIININFEKNKELLVSAPKQGVVIYSHFT
jgi:hypothetical protein